MADYKQVETLIRDWFKRALAKAWHDNFLDPERHAIPADWTSATGEWHPLSQDDRARMLADYADHFERQVEEGDIGPANYRKEARRLADAGSVPLDSREVEVVAGQMLSGDAAIANATARWATGETDYQPVWGPELPETMFPRLVKEVDSDTSRRQRKTRSVPKHGVDAAGLTISQAFERYVNERKPKPATITGYRTSVQRFVDIIGDKDVAHVTKRDIAAFKDALLGFPKVLKAADRGLSARSVIDRYKDRPEAQRLSAVTINAKHISGVSVSLQWASENGYIDTVVSRGVRAKGPKKSKKDERLPYSIVDLNTIFSLPVYTEGYRPIGGAGEAAVWVPLLALFTGARLDEIGSLKVEHVTKISGIDLILIDDGKTDNAYRKVPIHDELKRLGFLRYVDGRRSTSKGTDKLFPLMRVGSSKKDSTAFSQWWGRYARAVVPDKRKVFHSFRHTVKRTLRNASVEKPLRDALMGHETDDVAEDYGLDEDGIGYEIENLHKAIQKIRYPGLEIIIATAPASKRKRYRRYTPKRSRSDRP
ncbi:tyrosine-type recombinase/integrase [Acetobacter sp. DsW_063]|uniref:tyrosine-type recombinase/integrase n=1 Tax=Acetobacter sp. DsW_063 TaxID=1514894 RepID=UPI000B73873E|nr:tyrosine-type recombinase/integrase [Acetobacter sp. DsW_063]OUJ14703.1 hypothetical protein HK28_11795 [Acetobacter sp. DsW_063]